MTQHHYITQRFRTVSDEIDALQRCGESAIFDEVALGQRKNEVAIGDIDLPSAELLGEDAVLHALHDVLGIVGAGQEQGVGHARHGVAREALAPAIAGGA
jgi:hypothetical protein